MGDACCYWGGDMEAPAFYTETYPHARYDWRCSECKRKILTGTKYQYVRMLFEGDWESYRTCNFCRAIIRDYCGGVHPHGDLAEMLLECMGYDLIKDEFVGDDDSG